MYDIHNIHIKDNMSEKIRIEFLPVTLRMGYTIAEAREEWGTGYTIKTNRGKHCRLGVPAASATFTVIINHTAPPLRTITVIVNGPRLLVNKTVSKPVVNISEDWTVTVSVNISGISVPRLM